MALSEAPADRHRQIGSTFTARVRGTRDWDVPSPVAGWSARDVVRHLVEWFPSFLSAGAGVDLPRGPSVDQDPVAAWVVHCAGVQAVLDEAIDRFYTADVFMHTWDLARATGQDDRLDPDFCALLLAGMVEVEDAMRSSGQYGAR